jgi:hypothetical protein
MRDNSYDRTIERNYLQKWRFLIPEYEAVKAGRSEAFQRVGDFYRHHGTCSQTFRKYYNRYPFEVRTRWTPPGSTAHHAARAARCGASGARGLGPACQIGLPAYGIEAVRPPSTGIAWPLT